MHVATVFAGVPNPYEAGGMLMHWASINALRDAGHQVTFISLPWEERPKERTEPLRRLGVDVRVLPDVPSTPPPGRWAARAAYARSLVWPGQETLFPAVANARNLAAEVEDVQPDVLLADGNSAIAAAHALPLPKLAFMGDPPGASRLMRMQWDPLYPRSLRRDALLYRLGIHTFAFRADRQMLDFLRGYDSAGVFGAHRAEWARQHGVNAWYVRSPIMDAVGADWRRLRDAQPPNPRPRILLIGHLRGVATISGLHVFVDEVLPKLTEALGPTGFDARIVGAHDPPASIAGVLEDHPAVHLLGHVEPPDEEFLRADLLLVPTPVETGPRVRILSAFSYGCCVVAHEANRLGIPQLAHEDNILLADTPGLARETLRAVADPSLRERLGSAGRKLYEAEFTPEQAGARIVDELQRIAGRQ
jgi:glycosyltransferase involved in cell wall biosynthesis